MCCEINHIYNFSLCVFKQIDMILQSKTTLFSHLLVQLQQELE
jgi:hypothetical protein